jgi:hypothetical protein
MDPSLWDTTVAAGWVRPIVPNTVATTVLNMCLQWMGTKGWSFGAGLIHVYGETQSVGSPDYIHANEVQRAIVMDLYRTPQCKPAAKPNLKRVVREFTGERLSKWQRTRKPSAGDGSSPVTSAGDSSSDSGGSSPVTSTGDSSPVTSTGDSSPVTSAGEDDVAPLV